MSETCLTEPVDEPAVAVSAVVTEPLLPPGGEVSKPLLIAKSPTVPSPLPCTSGTTAAAVPAAPQTVLEPVAGGSGRRIVGNCAGDPFYLPAATASAEESVIESRKRKLSESPQASIV